MSNIKVISRDELIAAMKNGRWRQTKPGLYEKYCRHLADMLAVLPKDFDLRELSSLEELIQEKDSFGIFIDNKNRDEIEKKLECIRTDLNTFVTTTYAGLSEKENSNQKLVQIITKKNRRTKVILGIILLATILLVTASMLEIFGKINTNGKFATISGVVDLLLGVAFSIFEVRSDMQAQKDCPEIQNGSGVTYKDCLDAGWNNLCCGKFELAEQEFRDAIQKNASGHEAYFGKALANNKIRLLDVGDTGSKSEPFDKMPSYCDPSDVLYTNRKFEDDSDFKKALKLSQYSAEIQEKYKNFAEKINDIICAFKQYRNEGKQYGCFICAKITEIDSDGKPVQGRKTEDCKWAIRLHENLKKNGLCPFFSECDITEEAGEAGTQFEALILYALLQAKCMIIVCTEYAYYENSEFVRNEYERFKSFLNANGRQMDRICLVCKEDNHVYLPGIEDRQAIHVEEDMDESTIQKVISYAQKFVPQIQKPSACTLRSAQEESGASEQARPLERAEQVPFSAGLTFELVKNLGIRSETYKVSGAGNCKDEIIRIPSTCDEGGKVTSVGGSAFRRVKDLISVVIPDSVTSIGKGAFYKCSSLTSITLPFVGNQKDGTENTYFGYIFGASGYSDNREYVPSSLKTVVITGGSSIGNSACYNCSSLTSIEIPDSVTSIGYRAFYNCSSLTSIVIPDSVKSIGDSAFYNCSSLTSIVIPDSVTSIGDETFRDCSNLTSIEIPDSVTRIGDCAFYDCSNLTNVTIGNGVTSIGRCAFWMCSSLTSIVIPESVKSIDNTAFDGCEHLKIEVAKRNPVYYSRKGRLSSKKKRKKKRIALTISVLSLCAIAIAGSYFYVKDYLAKKHCKENGHTVVVDRAKAATCTEIGLTEGMHCSVCKKRIIEQTEIPATGHTEKKVPGKDATCTESGLTDGVQCSVCNEWLTKQTTINALDHTEKKVPGKAATCTESGITDGVQCSACNVWITEQTTINALGHKEKKIPGKAATCTASGLTDGVQCSVCNEWITKQTTINALGHTEKKVPGKAATCTESGLTDGVQCSVCNEWITKQTAVNALGHTEKKIPGKAATCTETGLTDGVQCSVCNEWITKQSIVLAKGHSYATGVCTSCGEKQPASKGLEFTQNSDGKSYYVSGIGTCTDTDIVIPSVYDGLPVTSVGNWAFDGCRSMASVVIPDSVTSVGNYAFWGCSNLTSIEIPDKPLLMGPDAFYGTAYYDDAANWTGGVLYIGKHLFEAKTDISGEYTIQEGTKVIADSAFEDCSSLTSIVIPDSVTSIGDSAFYNCSSLASIEIPDSVTSIGDWAFGGCSSLNYNTYENAKYLGNAHNPYVILMKIIDTSITDYEIPTQIKVIYDYAFYGCRKLTSIEIPDGVTSIGNSAFSQCSVLTRITVADGNPVYHSTDNCLIETASKTLIAGCSTSVIPADGSVTSIGSFAFSVCSSLTSIVIPSSVTSIGSLAFSGCSNLTSIVIPESVTRIDSCVFSRCSNLKIYCEAKQKPNEWNERWNDDNRPVQWGYRGNKY